MKASSNVPSELLKSTESTMGKLFADVRAIADLAAKSATTVNRQTLKKSASDPSLSPSKGGPRKSFKICGKTDQNELLARGYAR
eukprot:6019981-Karenia_brevis.AAC.1